MSPPADMDANGLDVSGTAQTTGGRFGPIDTGLSELDRALAAWARRHGATPAVAHGFALASWAVAQGDTCLTLNRIPNSLMNPERQRALPAALDDSPLVGGPAEIRPLIIEHGRLYLQRFHAYEVRLAQRLHELMVATPHSVDIHRLQPGQGLFEPAPDGQTNWQAVAAFVALRHRFSVISGGPGTGKTHTIVRLLRVLVESAMAQKEKPPLIALAAPTGKAAARMSDAVRAGLATMAADGGFDPAIQDHVPTAALTLHRLLGLTGTSTRPRFHTENPLPSDVVIVDEASMIDLPMMAKLAEAVRADARLILLGDRYQLASVESGAVLAELCDNAGVNQFSAEQQAAAGALLAGRIEPAGHALADHVVTLQTSRRFNADSAIGRLAAAVNAGDVRQTHEVLAADAHNVTYREYSEPSALSGLMDELAEAFATFDQICDPSQALARLAHHRMLTATRQGPAGSETLNAGVTARLARRFDFSPSAAWYHGRPILIVQNDYRCALFNGDVGIALRSEGDSLRVWFAGDNGPRQFLPSALPPHETVYAMTVHKSQGSEFDAVTLVLPDRDTPILSRELFYTGLTRARNALAIYAGAGIVERTITRHTARGSGLADRISAASRPC